MLTAKVVEAPDGLYHAPVNIYLELSAFALVGAALLFGAIYGRRLDLSALIVLTLLTSVFRYRYFLRYGTKGRPVVSVNKDVLYIDRPNDTREGTSLPIQDLKRLIIYGPSAARTYRLLRSDGTFCDVKPQWTTRLHQQVATFLIKALPGRVIVEEPQTIFAAIRSDGPESDA